MRSFRNRLVAGSLAASLGFGAAFLSGCGSSGSSGGTTSGGKPYSGQTLTVLQPTPTTDIKSVNKFNRAVAADFNKATGAKLQIQTYTSASNEFTAIETSAVSHSGPDVMNLGTTLVPAAYATHDFDTLSSADWAKIGGRSKFYQPQLRMSGPDSNTDLGVPVDAIPYAMAYNKTLFAKAHISGPPKTWSQYIADAKKINDPAKGIYGTGIDPSDPYDPWKDFWTVDLQLGTNFLSKDGKTSLLDNANMVQAVSFWFDWYTKFHVVNPSSLTWNSSDLIDSFAAGKVGEIPLQDIADVPTYESGAIGKNFAFAPAPTVPYGMTARPAGGVPAQSNVSGQDDIIAKYAPQGLALQYLKIVTSKPVQELQYKLTGELPVTTLAGQAVESKDPSLIRPFITALDNSQPTPFTSAWGTVETAMGSATNKLATKVVSSHSLSAAYIKSVLAAANQAVQRQL